jgi:peptidoglycan/LPS O-acetylase OafA/YrhL
MNKAGHLLPLDGLRGALALWVVAYHSLTISNCYAKLPRGSQVLADGGHAVTGFVILSGFVITRLLFLQHEPYPIFIARRYLRLFPTFAFAIILALLVQHWGLMPSRLPPGEAWAYLLSHLTMLFCALPASVPGSGSAILNPAWSISLEWQFYLVAPLFALVLGRGFGGLVIASAICAVADRVVAPVLGSYGFGFGFLPSYLALFWLGMVTSWLSMTAHLTMTHLKIIAVLALFGALLFLPYSPNIGTIVWLAFIACMVVLPRLTEALMGNPWVTYLGAISYPVYLLHEPLMWLLLRPLRSVQEAWLLALLLFFGTCLVVLPLSALIHHLVERPVIDWGKRVLARTGDSWRPQRVSG